MSLATSWSWEEKKVQWEQRGIRSAWRRYSKCHALPTNWNPLEHTGFSLIWRWKPQPSPSLHTASYFPLATCEFFLYLFICLLLLDRTEDWSLNWIQAAVGKIEKSVDVAWDFFCGYNMDFLCLQRQLSQTHGLVTMAQRPNVLERPNWSLTLLFMHFALTLTEVPPVSLDHLRDVSSPVVNSTELTHTLYNLSQLIHRSIVMITFITIINFLMVMFRHSQLLRGLWSLVWHTAAIRGRSVAQEVERAVL